MQEIPPEQRILNMVERFGLGFIPFGAIVEALEDYAGTPDGITEAQKDLLIEAFEAMLENPEYDSCRNARTDRFLEGRIRTRTERSSAPSEERLRNVLAFPGDYGEDDSGGNPAGGRGGGIRNAQAV